MKYLTCIILIAVMSCQSSIKEVENLEKEVIAIHDVAMAKTNDIYDLKKALQGKLAVATDSARIFSALEKLDKADEAMLVWMDEYEGIDSSKDPADNKIQLENQKQKILEVQNTINSSIEDAQQLLAQEVQKIESKDSVDVD